MPPYMQITNNFPSVNSLFLSLISSLINIFALYFYTEELSDLSLSDSFCRIMQSDLWTLETVYPVFNRSNGIWSWITDRLGLRKEVAPTIQDFDADSIALPWHLIQISVNNLLITDHG